MVDEELRSPSKEIGERDVSLVDVESILLVHSNPRELLPPLCDLVAASCQFFLGLEQLEPRREPFVPCSGHMLRHRSSLRCGVCDLVIVAAEVELARSNRTVRVTSVTGFQWT